MKTIPGGELPQLLRLQLTTTTGSRAPTPPAVEALVRELQATGLPGKLFRIALDIGGERLNVDSRTPFAAGTRLLVRAVSGQQLRVERVLEQPAPKIEALVREALRSALPRQSSLAETLPRLRELVTELPQRDPARRAVEQLLGQVPAARAVSTPAGLRTAVLQSGLFAEGRLRAAARDTGLAASGAAPARTAPDAPVTRAAPPDALLKTLRLTLASLLAQPPPRSEPPTIAGPSGTVWPPSPSPRARAQAMDAQAVARAGTTAAGDAAAAPAQTRPGELRTDRTADLLGTTAREPRPLAGRPAVLPRSPLVAPADERAATDAGRSTTRISATPGTAIAGRTETPVPAPGAATSANNPTTAASPRVAVKPPPLPVDTRTAPARPADGALPPGHTARPMATRGAGPAGPGNGAVAADRSSSAKPAPLGTAGDAARREGRADRMPSPTSTRTPAAENTTDRPAPTRRATTAAGSLAAWMQARVAAVSETVTTAPKDPLRSDLKIALARAAAALRASLSGTTLEPAATRRDDGLLYTARGLLGTSPVPPQTGAASAPQTPRSASEPTAVGAAPARLAAAAAAELLDLVESSLARTRLHQLQTLADPAANSIDREAGPSWSIELPLARGEQYDNLALRIRGEPGRDDKGQPLRIWHVLLRLDIDELGPVHVKLSLAQQRLSATLWAARERTFERMRRELDQLSAALLELGVDLDRVECLPGEPPQEPRWRQSSILDLET